MRHVKHYIYLARLIFMAVILISHAACGTVGDLSTSTPEPSAIPITPADVEAVVTVDIAPLRLLPDTASLQIATLNRGSEVRVIGISSDGEWYLVKVTGLQNAAWISAEFVTTDTLQPTKTATTTPSLIVSDALTATFTETPVQLILTVVGDNSSATPVAVKLPTKTFTLAPIATPTNTIAPIETPTHTATACPTPPPIDTPSITSTGLPPLTFTPSGP